MRRLRQWRGWAVLVLLLVSCGSQGSHGPEGSDNSESSKSSPLILSLSCGTFEFPDPSLPSSLTATVQAEDSADTAKTTFAQGEPITLRITLTNPTDSPTKLTFSSGQAYDFFISDATETCVWIWSVGFGFTGAVVELTVQPHETKEFVEVWDQRGKTSADQAGAQVPPGVYQILAAITTSSNTLATLSSPEKPTGVLEPFSITIQ